MGRHTYAPWTAQRFCRFAGGHGACFPDRVTLNWNWTMLEARQESSVRACSGDFAREGDPADGVIFPNSDPDGDGVSLLGIASMTKRGGHGP